MDHETCSKLQASGEHLRPRWPWYFLVVGSTRKPWPVYMRIYLANFILFLDFGSISEWSHRWHWETQNQDHRHAFWKCSKGITFLTPRQLRTPGANRWKRAPGVQSYRYSCPVVSYAHTGGIRSISKVSWNCWSLTTFSLFISGFMERVEEGSIKITAGKFPAFMYASDTVFHPKKEFEGLFQGYLLVRVSWFLNHSSTWFVDNFFRFIVIYSQVPALHWWQQENFRAPARLENLAWNV